MFVTPVSKLDQASVLKLANVFKLTKSLKFVEANYCLVGLTNNFEVGALWKFLAATLTKLARRLFINFFMISVVGYYTNRTTTLKIKFSIVFFIGSEDTLKIIFAILNS